MPRKQSRVQLLPREFGRCMTRFEGDTQYRSKADMLQLLRRLGYPGEMIDTATSNQSSLSRAS
jgi:hypothetical protein